MPRRVGGITIAVLIVTAVILTVLDSSGNLDGALNLVRNPIATVLSWLDGPMDAIVTAVSGPRDLQLANQQIADLTARIEQLERENEELREVEGEYQSLLDLFNRARQSPELRRIVASNIAEDVTSLVQSIVIDKGAEDGVTVGMPVESARGLVGRVYRVTNEASQVALIMDSASAVPVRLSNSRATGILRGGGVGGEMVVDWIDLRYQIEIGEVVFTSGLGGGAYPPDILVGRVIDVNRSEADLFQQAVVQPSVDFDALEILFVVTDYIPINIDIFEQPTDDLP